MAIKQFFVDGLGEVSVAKRRGTRRLSLKIVGSKITVTMPTWLPYSSGLHFATANRIWIDKQKQIQPNFLPKPNTQVGKLHTLHYLPAEKLKTKVTYNDINIFIPPHLHMHSVEVLTATKKAINQALKKEAQEILVERLNAMAEKYGYKYKSVRFKKMRTRWGSCTSLHDLTFNLSLLFLPYELIDYVILHELAHTKFLNHSKDFWDELKSIMPDCQQRRKQLKNTQHQIMALH